MENPVTILNAYRLSVLSNPEHVQVLARLLRDGPQQVSELAANLAMGVPALTRYLTILYRAAMVDRKEADLFALADLGEWVLRTVKIAEIASVDIAATLTEAPTHRLFIKNWLERPSATADTRTCMSLLRSLNQITNLQALRGESVVNRTSLLYAILIATDPSAQQLEVGNDSDVGKQALSSDRISESGHSEQEVELTSVEAGLREGRRKYIESNRILLFIPYRPPHLLNDRGAVSLTWLRALDAALGGTADAGFQASCRGWRREDATEFWSSMFERRSFEDDSRWLFEKWSGIRQPSTEVLTKQLTDRLLKAVRKATAGEPPTERRLAVHVEKTNLIVFERLIELIREASEHVRSGAAGILPDATTTALRSALAELDNALIGKVIPLGTGPQNRPQ